MSLFQGFLLDTNAISETQKPRPNPSVLSFFQSTSGSHLYLSVLTLGELRKGDFNKRQRHSGMTGRYSLWIDMLERSYADRMLTIDKPTANLWGELSAGHSRPVVDTLLAATAIVHGLTLVTRNTADFQDLPVKLLNPWRT
jgi:toxin FitB